MTRQELDAKVRELKAELNAGKFGTGADVDWEAYDNQLIALQAEFCRTNLNPVDPLPYVPNAEDFETGTPCAPLVVKNGPNAEELRVALKALAEERAKNEQLAAALEKAYSYVLNLGHNIVSMQKAGPLMDEMRAALKAAGGNQEG